jgi:sugar phosphate isomerase/epimerase
MFEGMEIERICDLVADIGYDGLEIAPFALHEDVREMPQADKERVRKALDDSGLECAGLHWLLTKPEGLHIGDPDDALRRETADYLVTLAEFCALLGGRDMIFGSPKSRDVPEGGDRLGYWQRAQDTVRSAGERAHELGAVIAMEPLARSISNFLNHASEVRRFVGEIDHPGVRMMVDCYSMGDESIPRSQIIAESGDLILHVHANDTTMREPGTGDLDFSEVVTALKGIGYDGWVSLEVFEIDPDPETMARRGYELMAEEMRRQGVRG